MTSGKDALWRQSTGFAWWRMAAHQEGMESARAREGGDQEGEGESEVFVLFL